MKLRLPTLQERKLWRESNRHTTCAPTHDSDVTEDADDTLAEALPQAVIVPTPPLARPTKNTAPAPLALRPWRVARRDFALHPIGATLDLHGMHKLEAYTRVQHFIVQQQRMQVRHVLIITGKGRLGEQGVLCKNLPHWLNEAGLRPCVSAMAHAPSEKGGSGALHVLLKYR
jgi:DNA-nicking Smr family endonuclease